MYIILNWIVIHKHIFSIHVNLRQIKKLFKGMLIKLISIKFSLNYGSNDCSSLQKMVDFFIAITS